MAFIFPVALEVTFKASSTSFSVILLAGNVKSLPKYFSDCDCSQSQQLVIVLSWFSVSFFFLTRNVRERAASHEEAEGSGR